MSIGHSLLQVLEVILELWDSPKVLYSLGAMIHGAQLKAEGGLS